MSNNVKFSVFVENGSVYRDGGMLGVWFELPMSDDELESKFAEIGIAYHDDLVLNKDYVITDFENSIDYKVGDDEPIDLLNDLASRLEDVQCMEWLTAYMNETGESLDEAIERYEDNSEWFNGYTLTDVAEAFADDTEELSEFARRYFDYDAFANDLRIDGYVEYDGGVIYVY